jgi:hypothetical protein
VEAGTTIEVIVGTEGCLAVRRRHRVWALDERAGARVVAMRGLAGWEDLVDDHPKAFADRSGGRAGDPSIHLLTPEAAAPLVAALAEAFHGQDSPPWEPAGLGWSLSDQPSHPNGLAGGSFDDVGSASTTRTLAKDGSWAGNLSGPGMAWRRSYREPPVTTWSNLVLGGDRAAPPDDDSEIAGTKVDRCRVMRMSRDLWALELAPTELADGSKPPTLWVRTHPKALLDACTGTFGCKRVTSEGVITSGLVLKGISE